MSVSADPQNPQELSSPIPSVNDTTQCSPNCNQTSSGFISPQIFKGFPKAGERKGVRKPQAKVSSCIVTDTPEKNKIEAKWKDRASRKRKPNKVSKQLFPCSKKKREKDFISSDSDDELQISSMSSDSESSNSDKQLQEQVDPSCFQLDREPKQDDFVLVEFKVTRHIFYVAKVISPKDQNGDIEVSFLRKSVKYEGYFCFPNVQDISFIAISDVKMILPKTELLGSTKRLRSFYKFGVNFDLITVN